MSQKIEKPVLQGQRIKTRKRDEKEKYDPLAFRDAILQGLNESKNDLDQVAKFLDSAGSKLDYRRYNEPLLDCLFAGGILAPGGSIVEDGDEQRPCSTTVCVFGAESEHSSLRQYYEVLYKLIRRYKYIEKPLEEEFRKLIRFLKGFNEQQRFKLATMTGICLANGLGNPICLDVLFEDHLVKEGYAIDFASVLFHAWLLEKDMGSLGSALKRAGLDSKLLNLLPFNKRSVENFENHFKAADLSPIVQYQRARACGEIRRMLHYKIHEMVEEDIASKEIVSVIVDEMSRNKIDEHEVIAIVWSVLMSSMEWNKKEELVADQAVKHLHGHTSLLSAFTKSPRSELYLMGKVQDYCYDNMAFQKVFSKIIMLFYKTDVVSEDVILKWYKESHSQKGQGIFLIQMKKFVDWLENAEEESEEDEEDDD